VKTYSLNFKFLSDSDRIRMAAIVGVILSLLGVAGLAGVASGTEARAKAIEERLRACEVALAELGVLPAEVVGIIDRIEATLSEHEEKITSLEDTSTVHEERIASLEDISIEYGERIASLEDISAAHEERITSHEERITTLEREVDDISTRLDKAISDLRALEASLRALEDQVGGFKEEYASLKASLSDELAGLSAKFMRVAEELRVAPPEWIRPLAGKFGAISHELREMSEKLASSPIFSSPEYFNCLICGHVIYVEPTQREVTCEVCGSEYRR